ncbi:MAG: hypothetical protein ABSE89_00300 [Sedimentisphaerales bacterium]
MDDEMRIKRNHKNAGYILLLLLLIFVLIGMWFVIKPRKVKEEFVQDINNPPWQQWEKIQKQLTQGGLGTPDPQQPQITEVMMLKTELFENKRGRGTIVLRFNPDLSIEGTWLDKFYIDPNKSREFELSDCSIKGFLIPDETYADIEKTNEPNNVYFLAKGRFLLVDYNYETNKTDKIEGYIYISGWLLPDWTIRDGQAIMTSDTERLRMFYFKAKAGKMSLNRLLGLP